MRVQPVRMEELAKSLSLTCLQQNETIGRPNVADKGKLE